MIQDNEIMQSVSKIIHRAERQSDIEKIIASFVDIGILPQLNNRNNQVFYGRRGTGKTHILRILETLLQKQKNAVTVYIDARVLGSTNQFSDHNVPLKQRYLSLFRDILLPIYETLLAHIIQYPTKSSADALTWVNELLMSITQPVTIYKEDSVSTSSSSSSGSEFVASASLDLSRNIGVTVNSSAKSDKTGQINRSYRVESDDKVIFPELYNALTNTLRFANVHLYILMMNGPRCQVIFNPTLQSF